MADETHNNDGERQNNPHPEAVQTRAPTVVWKSVGGKGGLTWSGSGGRKLVIHTTETAGLPTYPYPPHLTVDLLNPDPIYQHVTLEKGAYAMKSASPESPNYEAGQTWQIEHIGYASATPNQPDEWYRNLAREVLWFHENRGVPLVFADFTGSGGYGDWAGRMTQSEFKAFSGVCGHQHAPSPNAHWDPGDLDVAKLKRFIDDLQEDGDELADLSPAAQKYFQEIYESLKTDPDKPNKGDENPPGARLFSNLASFHRWAIKKTGKQASEYEGIVARFMDKT